MTKGVDIKKMNDFGGGGGEKEEYRIKLIKSNRC